jgi:hypothetical protein
MRTRKVEFRAIPQFDSGRWKLRLERMPVDPDNEITMGIDFNSAAQASANETNEMHCFQLPTEPRQTRTINSLSNESGGASD